MAQDETVDDVVEQYPFRLTFDIVATADIEVGVEVVLDTAESKEYGIPVDDEFFSRKWRGLEELTFTWDW
eukprot:CAMPEP_0116546730 /NCGR_PEP_ID=MMETSP0397-20121206/3383_1 /TAXON_ID=216820 /ORGANISM="Cyclophora tenuis, Strain ECT3854" /LENGTH=69 /DNA_ID=CAMNT_0004071181 /DNA_START=240 /DNA_END=449 /DNA_ORIENTATION=+